MAIEKQPHPLLMPAFQFALRQRVEKFRTNADLTAYCSKFSFGLRSGRHQFGYGRVPARNRYDLSCLDARQKWRKVVLAA
jgi:hypothetical protein